MDNTFGSLQNGHESGTAEEPPRVCGGVEETGEPVLPLRAAPVWPLSPLPHGGRIL